MPQYKSALCLGTTINLDSCWKHSKTAKDHGVKGSLTIEAAKDRGLCPGTSLEFSGAELERVWQINQLLVPEPPVHLRCVVSSFFKGWEPHHTANCRALPETRAPLTFPCLKAQLGALKPLTYYQSLRGACDPHPTLWKVSHARRS